MMTKPTIRSNAKRKQNLGLTVTQATSQARRHVDRIMPGVMATVDSRTSYDLKADVPIVITTVTFPHMHAGISDLRAALHALPGMRDFKTESARMTFTRTI